MIALLSALLFTLGNTISFLYAYRSANVADIRGLLLLPLLWFPFLYVLNIAFSGAFFLGSRTLGITALMLLNIGSYFLILVLGNHFFLHESLTTLQFVGASCILVGIVLVAVYA